MRNASFLLFASMLAAAACADDATTNPAPHAKAASYSPFASAYAHALCDHLAPCCQQEGLAFDAEACLAEEARSAEVSYVKPGEAIGATYDPKAADACIAKITAIAQGCQVDWMGALQADAACQVVFTGTKQPGAACQQSNECAQPVDGTASCVDNHEKIGPGDALRMCRAIVTAKGGEPCGLPVKIAPVVGGCGSGESDGFTCDATTHRCVPRAAIGAACKLSDDCVKEAYCADDAKGATCQPRVAIGGACPTGTECNAQGRCDMATGLCVALLQNGEKCLPNQGCAGICIDQKCVTSWSIADASRCTGHNP